MKLPMRFRARVWSLGKLLLLAAALGGTFLLFFSVSMRVALRTREVQVPPLAGRTLDEAAEALAELGLGLRVDENRRPDDRIAAGRVVQQDPAAGVQARRQRTVRVWISAGPRAITVPNLVGQTERTAELRIEADQLDLEALSEIRSSEYPADTVVAQDPPPAARATRVSVLLNRGGRDEAYIMPDVIGMDGQRAADVLRGLGFRVTITGTQPYAGVPPGTVVRQQPAGGFRVAPAGPISLEVSR
jgi:beta-lactam-binding protein with PASTA domain